MSRDTPTVLLILGKPDTQSSFVFGQTSLAAPLMLGVFIINKLHILSKMHRILLLTGRRTA